MLHFLSPDFFEGVMLICFGAAWPFSIYKSFITQTNQGKSLRFLLIILIGYISGIIFQFTSPGLSKKILILFFINSFLVTLDIVIYFRNRLLSNKRISHVTQ